MLRPMGFPENVSAIAWGLSLERPTMIQFGLSNIKELFGMNIKKVKESAIYCI
jgi:phenylalanyl-tRNA synthetase alpha chain